MKQLICLLSVASLFIAFPSFAEEAKDKIMIGPQHPYVQGVWFWTVKEGELDQVKELDGVEPQGAFLLEYKDGAVSGLSIIEAPLAKNSDNMKSVVFKSPLKGTAKKNSDGTSDFQFTVTTEKGNQTTSSATLAKDGRSMTGSSNSVIKREDGSSIKVSYSWVAKRP